MKQYILITAIILGSAATPLYAAAREERIRAGGAGIRLRDLDISGLSVNRNNLTLTATFDVKGARIFDEVIFDFYLLLTPQDKIMKPQFLHCRTVHRYLDRKSGYKSGVVLNSAVIEGNDPRDEKYAVVITYEGKEVGVENSESRRWWEDAELGPPVENILVRFADVPIVRVWESAK